MKRLAGFTIVEIVIGTAVFAVLAVIVLAIISTTEADKSDDERYNEAAFNLDQLARAIAHFEPTKRPVSFKGTVGVYPGKLSQLTSKISTTQKNDCGAVYTALQSDSLWTGGYFLEDIPTTGYKLASGFVTSDSLVRVPTTNTVPQGVLSIIIPNVILKDAQGLGQLVDNSTLGTFGTVRFSTSPMVTVSYRIEIGNC